MGAFFAPVPNTYPKDKRGHIFKRFVEDLTSCSAIFSGRGAVR